MRNRLTHREKYGHRDDLNERSGPTIHGRIVGPGVCSHMRLDDAEPCGAVPIVHVAVLDQSEGRVIEVAACMTHAHTAREAAENMGTFVNEHRYQFGLCDKAIDWQCHAGRTERSGA